MPANLARTMVEGAAVMVSRGPALPGPLAGMQARRRMVERHLRRVCGPDVPGWRLSRLADETFASYARYWVETLRLPHLSPARVAAGITYDHFEFIQAGYNAGRGTILALPHLGGWEWAGTHLAQSGFPISVVVERLQPPEVFEWFAAFRERLGMQVIPVGPDAAARCVRALRDNHLLCLLSDRLVGDSASVEVDFFGETTSLPAGPATLAIRTGAALLPCAVYFGRRADQHPAIVRPPLDAVRTGRLRHDVIRLTQALTHQFEDLIRLAPTQWHLMQPNWPSDENGQVAASNGWRSTRR
jgi:KDO2-lipid IV(A) lauroyltransferase